MSDSESGQASFAFHVGRTVGKYTLESLIGRGGMAEVYKSTHPELGRPLAIKILHPFHTDIDGFVERFRQEAKVIATLRHPHIVQVYDFAVTEDGLHYMVMEYIDGVSLDVYLQRHPGPLPLKHAYTLFRQVAEALHAAHEKGIIHRDVKPANILIDRQGTAFLTDFGIAQILGAQRLTLSYMSPGTPSFMAPEQGSGRPITRAADIYALGGLLYQLLTGRLPYEDENPVSLIMRKSSQTPVPPSFFNTSLPAAVDDVIMRAMALNPQERFPDALAMLHALEQARGAESSPEQAAPVVAGEAVQAAIDEKVTWPAWILQIPELPHYQIKNLISENLYTQRFLAYSSTLEQLCLLDVMRASVQQAPDLAALFRQHWQGMAQLSHPHLAAVITVDLSLDHRLFVAFEHVAGASLAELLAEGRPFPWSAAQQLLRPIAQALATAHESGFVHQDLRPEQIMLRQEGDPVLVGLGGPAITNGKNGARNGAYAAPEQQKGQPVSVRSNLYSLGVVLWQLLTGQQASQSGVLLTQPPAGLPNEAVALLRLCLQPQPENRPASWAEFLRLLDAPATPVPENGKVKEKRPFARPLFWQPVAALLAVLALLAASVWAWRANQPVPAGENAQGGGAVDTQKIPELVEATATESAPTAEPTPAVTTQGNEPAPSIPATSSLPETPAAPADNLSVRISHITYNPPGDDSVGEFVRIVNDGATAVNMSGWMLQDDARTPHVYTFPAFTLAPGAFVQVWTGAGQDDDANLYWAFGFAIWNNDGDVATLFTSSGEMVSQCAYAGGAIAYDCP